MILVDRGDRMIADDRHPGTTIVIWRAHKATNVRNSRNNKLRTVCVFERIQKPYGIGFSGLTFTCTYYSNVRTLHSIVAAQSRTRLSILRAPLAHSTTIPSNPTRSFARQQAAAPT